MAVSYIIADDDVHAIELLERTLKLNPQFDRALFLLGSIYLWRQRLNEADGALILRRCGSSRETLSTIASWACYVPAKRVQNDDAEKEFREAISISPSYALPYFHLGRILAREKEKVRKPKLSLQGRLNCNQICLKLTTSLGCCFANAVSPRKKPPPRWRISRIS